MKPVPGKASLDKANLGGSRTQKKPLSPFSFVGPTFYERVSLPFCDIR